MAFGQIIGSEYISSKQWIIRSNNAIEFMQMLASFGKGKASIRSVMKGMRIVEDTTESIQKFYDESLGI
jgi:hypothetical protein